MDDRPAAESQDRPAPASARFVSRPALAVIVGFFLMCLAAQYAVRLDYGPDEPDHLEYIHVLAAERRLPAREETHQACHPPVYYALMAPLWAAAGVDQEPASLSRGPGALGEMSERSKAARRVLRLANTLLACLTLLVLARILALVGATGIWQAVLLFLVAVSPMFEYVASVVNNENLAILYSAVVCLALATRIWEGTCSTRQAVLLGLLLGAATLIKQTTLFAFPLGLWTVWCVGDPGPRWKRVGLFAAAGLAVGIWWPLYLYRVSGIWFPNYAVPPDQAEARAAALSSLPMMLDWLRIAVETAILPEWSRLFLRRSISTFCGVVTAAVLVGAFLYRLREKGDSRRQRLRAMSLTAVVLMLAGILYYTLFTDWRGYLSGRYLLNSVTWAVLLLGASLPPGDPARDSSAPEHRFRLDPLAVLAGGTVLTLGTAFWWYLVRVYYLGIDSPAA